MTCHSSVCLLYQKGENCVSEKRRRLPCTIVQTMISYSKGINVKIADDSMISSDKVND